MCVGRRPAPGNSAGNSRRNGADPRPSAHRPDISQLARTVRTLSAVADSCCLPLAAAVAVTVAVSRDQESGRRRLILLAVPYLAKRLSRPPSSGWNSLTPPPNPTAAEPRDGPVLSRPSSRVHEPCIWRERLPTVTDRLTGSGSPRYSYGGLGGVTMTTVRHRGRPLAIPRGSHVAPTFLRMSASSPELAAPLGVSLSSS